jgi:4'-phosphopantetheinyl transferase
VKLAADTGGASGLTPARLHVASGRNAIVSSAAVGPNDVVVWRADLDRGLPERLASLGALLSADELERARRFYFERDRQRFVVGRAVLRALLAGYLGRAPREIAFRYGAHGKPELASSEGEPALHFNLAHSDALLLIAFARAGEVGVDVEKIRDLPDWESIARLSFSPSELERLRVCRPEERRDEFFRAWTRQEAVLKALGTGLGEPPGHKALNASACRIVPLHPAPGFAGALAVVRTGRREPERCERGVTNREPQVLGPWSLAAESWTFHFA